MSKPLEPPMLTVIATAQSRGVLRFAEREYPCALGYGGVSEHKREGDGATPAGTFQLRRVFYRADRLAAPHCRLPVRAITRRDGWCDDPGHPAYNRLIALPLEASHEAMWRDDGLYDLLVVIGHNDDPPQPGLGSAIFIHCASDDFSPTQGCVALAAETLQTLVSHWTPAMSVRISNGAAQAP